MTDFKLHEAFAEKPGAAGGDAAAEDVSPAEEYKRRGNTAFKEQNWDAAIKNYNNAIEMDPNQASFYSNRAACWSSKGKHDNALRDAKMCLERDKNFIKGYSRKGKALFDLQRLDEAEAAYLDGLAVDASNEACTQGITSVKAARRTSEATKQKASGGSSAGGFLGGLLGGSGAGMVQKLADRFKKGGRMQMYMVVMVGYMMYNQYIGKNSKYKTTGDETPSHETADEDAPVVAKAAPAVRRGFSEVGGSWLGHLEVAGEGAARTQLLCLHRTASSAEADFGGALERLAAQAQPGLQVLAPDRPCHGFSPCRTDGGAWLPGLLKKRRAGAAKAFAVVAAGEEAMKLALAHISRRGESAGEPARLLLLSPNAAAPARLPSSSTAEELAAWLATSLPSGAAAGRATAAAAWATAAKTEVEDSGAEEEEERHEKLPDGVTVTLLYAAGEKENAKLKHQLEDRGAEVSVRRLKAAAGDDEAFAQELASEAVRLLRSAAADDGEDL